MDNQSQPIYTAPGTSPMGYPPQPAPFPPSPTPSTPGTTGTIGYTVPPPASTQPPKRNLGMIISLILVSLLLITFLALFFWAYSNLETERANTQAIVDKEVAVAVNDKVKQLEADFTEREKSPYATFTGPEDYGYLTFQYPKTWSLYISKDATNGGDFESFLNPGAVSPVSSNTINALRTTILDKAYDATIKTYESRVKNGKMSVNVRLINGENANVYSGELPTGGFIGHVAIFPIRDKTVLLQTDAEVFKDDFNRVLDTVQYTK